MPMPVVSRPPPAPGKDYRIRPLKRGDKEPLFRLLADDGWVVPGSEQETVLSWVVQHPEMESFVAHHATSYGSVFAVLTLSHRPQLRLGGQSRSGVVQVRVPASVQVPVFGRAQLIQGGGGQIARMGRLERRCLR